MNEIFHRTSIRKYEDKPVEDSKVEKLLRAGMAAPSAVNQQPWEFYVIRDRKTIDRLGSMAPNVSPLKGAPLCLVLVYRNDCRLPEFAQIDMSICMENIWLETDSLGLGGVMMGIAPHEDRMEAVKKALDIPDNLSVFCLFAAGYPAETKEQENRFDPSRIHYIG
ncbi:MAG: nitroreductase family protein [Oscillospiraceae bacterium]|jgi:nitroreductase